MPNGIETDRILRVGNASPHAHILARTQFLAGKTFDSAYGFKYRASNGKFKPYSFSDYKLDLRDGNIQFDGFKLPVKTSLTPAQQELHMLVMAEMFEECHAAFNVTTGLEPQS